MTRTPGLHGPWKASYRQNRRFRRRMKHQNTHSGCSNNMFGSWGRGSKQENVLSKYLVSTPWALVYRYLYTGTASTRITAFRMKDIGIQCIACRAVTNSIHIPARILGTRFKARICISEPGPQEPYRDIFNGLNQKSANGSGRLIFLTT
jgi:hypothetical protein